MITSILVGNPSVNRIHRGRVTMSLLRPLAYDHGEHHGASKAHDTEQRKRNEVLKKMADADSSAVTPFPGVAGLRGGRSHSTEEQRKGNRPKYGEEGVDNDDVER